MFNAHKVKMEKKKKIDLSGAGKAIGNAAAKATNWPKGLNDMQLNRSGTVGTEPISKGNNKFTEVKAGRLGKLDIPMGTLKNKTKKKSEVAPVRSTSQMKCKTKKKNWIAGAIKKPGALKAELGVKKGNKIPAGKLAAAAKKSGKEGKRARLAETLKSFHKTKKKGEMGRAMNTMKSSAQSLGQSIKGYKPFSMSNSFDRQVASQAKSKKNHGKKD